MTNTLQQAQKIMLSILVSFDRLCRENNLTYWIDYGTLLGAVRHGGFIPWDDDIDVCMPRDDYTKFLQIAASELDNNLFLQTKKSDRHSPVHYAKLRDRKSTYIDKWEKNKNIRYHQGIFIDIYPVNFINPKYKGFYKVGLYFGKFFANRYLKLNFMAKSIIEILNKFHDSNASLVVLGAEGMVWDMECQRDDVFVLKRLTFEGQEFTVPKEYHKHLKKLYGKDYLSLPPKEKRIYHSCEIMTDLPCEYERQQCL